VRCTRDHPADGEGRVERKKTRKKRLKRGVRFRGLLSTKKRSGNEDNMERNLNSTEAQQSKTVRKKAKRKRRKVVVQGLSRAGGGGGGKLTSTRITKGGWCPDLRRKKNRGEKGRVEKAA